MSDLDPRYDGLAGLSSTPSGKSRSVISFVLHLLFTVPLLTFGLFGSPLLLAGSVVVIASGLAYLSPKPRNAMIPTVACSVVAVPLAFLVVTTLGDRHGAGILFGALSMPVFLATGLAWIRLLSTRGSSSAKEGA